MSLSVGKRFGELFGRGGIVKRILGIGCEGSGKPGLLCMQDEDGNDHFVFFDDDGYMRISTDTIPDADTDGVALPLLIKQDITYADQGEGAQTILAAYDGLVVEHCIVEVTTTFDGTTPTIDVGDASTADGFLANANITEGTAGYYGMEDDVQGSYLWDTSHKIKKVYTSAVNIQYTIAGSDATQGEATIYLFTSKLK